MSWLLPLLVIGGGVARAELPLPSYRDALSVGAYEEVDALYEERRYEEAIARAQAFEKSVMQTAGLEYLIGLCWRNLDDDKQAEKYLRHSIELDATYDAAWYDLGEILLVNGRFEEAGECFAHVSELRPSGPGSFLGPLRQAEVAAHLQQPEVFETHIKEALRRGFSFREIRGLPNWQKFYADPVMRESVVKMVTVYGTEDVLETLEPTLLGPP